MSAANAYGFFPRTYQDARLSSHDAIITHSTIYAMNRKVLIVNADDISTDDDALVKLDRFITSCAYTHGKSAIQTTELLKRISTQRILTGVQALLLASNMLSGV